MSMIIAVAKNVLDYNRIISLDEVFERIDAVTTGDFQAIAQDVFDEKKLTSLAFIPEN